MKTHSNGVDSYEQRLSQIIKKYDEKVKQGRDPRKELQQFQEKWRKQEAAELARIQQNQKRLQRVHNPLPRKRNNQSTQRRRQQYRKLNQRLAQDPRKMIQTQVRPRQSTTIGFFQNSNNIFGNHPVSDQNNNSSKPNIFGQGLYSKAQQKLENRVVNQQEKSSKTQKPIFAEGLFGEKDKSQKPVLLFNNISNKTPTQSKQLKPSNQQKPVVPALPRVLFNNSGSAITSVVPSSDLFSGNLAHFNQPKKEQKKNPFLTANLIQPKKSQSNVSFPSSNVQNNIFSAQNNQNNFLFNLNSANQNKPLEQQKKQSQPLFTKTSQQMKKPQLFIPSSSTPSNTFAPSSIANNIFNTSTPNANSFFNSERTATNNLFSNISTQNKGPSQKQKEKVPQRNLFSNTLEEKKKNESQGQNANVNIFTNMNKQPQSSLTPSGGSFLSKTPGGLLQSKHPQPSSGGLFGTTPTGNMFSNNEQAQKTQENTKKQSINKPTPFASVASKPSPFSSTSNLVGNMFSTNNNVSQPTSSNNLFQQASSNNLFSMNKPQQSQEDTNMFRRRQQGPVSQPQPQNMFSQMPRNTGNTLFGGAGLFQQQANQEEEGSGDQGSQQLQNQQKLEVDPSKAEKKFDYTQSNIQFKQEVNKLKIVSSKESDQVTLENVRVSIEKFENSNNIYFIVRLSNMNPVFTGIFIDKTTRAIPLKTESATLQKVLRISSTGDQPKSLHTIRIGFKNAQNAKRFIETVGKINPSPSTQ